MTASISTSPSRRPTVIRGGRVIDPRSQIDRLADVMIAHDTGTISAIDAPGAFDAVDAAFADAAGMLVTPGFVDLHSHLRTPGEEWKEDFASGSEAAARGGFTTICAMPNTTPAVDSVEVLAANIERARRESVVRVRHYACVTLARSGAQLAPLRSLADAGAVGFSDDGDPVASSQLMRAALEYTADIGRPIVNHAEDRALAAAWDMNEGHTATRLGLRGLPSAAESSMIARDIELARLTGGRLHVPHVSCRESVDLIRAAKEQGLPVTAEATPHHVALDERWVYGRCGETPEGGLSLDAYDTNSKMAPPLRDAADVAAIREAVAAGVIDAVATDHAPHAPTDKQCTFQEAANGIIGLETAFALLHGADRLALGDVIARLTSGPSDVLADDSVGSLRVGANADITVIDPDAEWTVDDATLGSKSRNTPLLGKTLRGRVVRTYVGGDQVWCANAEPGAGDAD